MTSKPRITATTFQRPPAVPTSTKVPFAFVHINKCGGSSIEIALGLTKRHAAAAKMRDEMGGAEWDRRFTFSVVRNPFTRVASIYYYRVRSDQAGLADRHLSFNAWVARVWGARDPAYLDDPLLCGPASDWLTEDDVLLVDQIARLETLAEDWATISARLGVDATLEHVNWNAYPPHRAIYSTEARALIEQAFAADLNRFGYAY